MPAPDNGLIGIDIRGTKIDAPVFDQADKIIFEKRLDTPKDYEPMVKAIAGLVQAAGAGTVGIRAPAILKRAHGAIHILSPPTAKPWLRTRKLPLAAPFALRMMQIALSFQKPKTELGLALAWWPFYLRHRP